MQLKKEIFKFRKPENEIDGLFLNRWSPRAFSEKKVSKKTLMQLIEAAKWAPSSFNEQPWRFIYAIKENDLKKFKSLLSEWNKKWAEKAPILIALACKKTFSHNGKENRNYSFDSGSAWENFALQATLMGLHCHAMAGYDKEKAEKELNVPKDFEIIAMIAVGYIGKKEKLPEEMKKNEQPNGRKKLKEIAFEEKFKQ